MGGFSPVVALEKQGEIGVLTLNAPPVNALSAQLRDGLYEGVSRASEDPGIKAIVILCAGRTFIAGADISEFGKPPQGKTLSELNALIENAPKPVIAAIHGTALGGGFELALSCHCRIAVPSAKVGLPEVKLGLLPGAGGTQRLPRLTGVEKALDLITSGAPIGAKAAAEMGIIDGLAGETTLRADAVSFAEKVIAEKRPLKKIRDDDSKIASARGRPEIFANFRKENERRFRGFEAPGAIIRAVEGAVSLSFDEGLALERKLFAERVASPQSAAQRYVFFAERKIWKIAGVADDVAPRPITRVGVIGSGTMGSGITMNFLSAGIPVTLVETQQVALDRGVAAIRGTYDSAAKKGRMSQDAAASTMALLNPTLNFDDLASCDLIIEAVFELMEVKKEIFTKLDAVAKAGAILATNTSYLDVNEIAAVTKRPQSVLGLHFFSPANIMKLLEVVRAEKTADDVLVTALALARKIGKVAVTVGVCYGFVGNRMLAQRTREANKLLFEGAMPWDVDRVIESFGMAMGPFKIGDLAGLDLGWKRETSKGETVRECLNELDRRGQKTGAGFYDYDAQRKPTPSKITEQIILDLTAKKGITRRAISDEEILERCLYVMINEGAKILEEGIAARASDVDIVWINGYGWPVYRGGPMFYADSIGLDKILARLRDFEKIHGADLKPAALLEKLAAEGKRFSDL